VQQEDDLKWVTREHVKVDRVACPWVIRKFIDQQAEFLFVPADQVMDVAKREGATPYDVKGVEYGHHGKECSFDAFVKKHGLARDPAIVLLAKIVNGADTDNSAETRGSPLPLVRASERTHRCCPPTPAPAPPCPLAS
jgi:hypothetical protein